MKQHQELGTSRWKQLRLRILARDNYECCYCGQEADSVDHIVSRALGGDMWDPENLVASCKRCNSAKGSKPLSKRVFSGASSTPPVFSSLSLPETHTTVPDSPFKTQNA